MAKRTSTKKLVRDAIEAGAPEEFDSLLHDYVTEEMGPQPFTIPGAPRPPQRSLARSLIWLYGDTGVGKTTLANQFPGAWFLATEKGQDWITTREPTLIHSWDHFIETCAAIEEVKPTKFGDGKPITHFVIDTVDLLFKLCKDDVSRTLGVEDPSELDHGKGWARLNGEFERVINKMRRWPFGMICISHERSREFKTRGRKVNRYEPDIGAGGFRVISSAADFIFRCYTDDRAATDPATGDLTGEVIEERMLQCHPTASAVAKCRNQDDIPAILPMSYSELMKALRK